MRCVYSLWDGSKITSPVSVLCPSTTSGDQFQKIEPVNVYGLAGDGGLAVLDEERIAPAKSRANDLSIGASGGQIIRRLLFSLQPLVNFPAGDRQARQAHAGGIEDRVADGRRYRRDRMLCGRFGVERARPLGSAADESGFTRRQIARRRDLVIAEAERGYATVFDEHFFANGHAQPLQHAAFDLALMSQRINHY
jgi:hypothetical protein